MNEKITAPGTTQEQPEMKQSSDELTVDGKTEDLDSRKPWHYGYYGGMEHDLLRHKEHLEFNSEFELGKLPPKLDLKVIKKEKNYIVDEDFGLIYKTYNIHEYKSDQDQLNIDELSQATAYGFLLKYSGRYVEEFPLDEITISVFRRSYPRELFRRLEYYKNERHLNINVIKKSPGIYYVEGISVFPTQIVVMKEFDKSHRALRALGHMITEEEALAFSKEILNTNDPADIKNIKAVLSVSVAANRELYERIWRELGMEDMDNAVLSIFKDKIKVREDAAAEQATTNNLYKYVAAGGMTVDFAAKERGLSPDVFISNMRTAGYSLPQPRA